MHLRGILMSAATVLAACVLFYAADNPKLPPPYATKAVNNRPRVIPQPNGAKLTVPPGFHTEVWAEDFDTPRFMMLGPGNEILLADSANPPQGAIYVFPGGDPNQRRKMIDGLNKPFGLAMLNGYLYVGEPDSIKRFRYDAKAMTAGLGEEVISLKGQGTHHWTRSLLFDRAGKKLYVGVGSGSNSSPGEDPRRAAINRYNVDGTGHEIYAAGTRNPIGMRWYPGTDTLWAAVQERDDLGDDLVPDYFTHIQEGGFYGWPYAYIGPHEDPTNKGLAPDLVAKTLVPDVLMGAHVAVLDFIFYTGKQFPAEYQGGAFVAEHGSWNRSKRVGQSIAFVPFKNGKPSGPPRQFLTGWMLGPDERDVWGRPVGLLQLPDGSLLISEDGNKKIWHVSYTK
ncbi:Cytochrome c, class I [Candidatus Sulfopaludibacter sp. SbA4]|nr:Cytochrome c, class I [Candidatus Sulfopaludibacter sp. SbA4]